MRLNLIDHSAFIHRAFHAMPPLVTSKGVPVGAVRGLCDSLLWMTRAHDFTATHWAAVGDAGRSGRIELDPGYKGTRTERDDDLISQFKLADQACEALGIPVIRIPGFEADDVIAALTRAFTAQGGDVLILSEDKDLMQLVGNQVMQYRPVEKKFYGIGEVHAKWGMPPHRINEALALMGDSVDNIPGVEKVGPKTAAKIVNGYPTFEAMLAACIARTASEASSTIVARIAGMADRLRLNLKLTTLMHNCLPGEFAFETVAAQERDYQKVLDFFTEFEFVALRERIEAQMDGIAA